MAGSISFYRLRFSQIFPVVMTTSNIMNPTKRTFIFIYHYIEYDEQQQKNNMSSQAICGSCHQIFSSKRYLKCHYRWNPRCKRKIFKLNDPEDDEEQADEEKKEGDDPIQSSKQKTAEDLLDGMEKPSFMGEPLNFYVNNTYESESDVHISMHDDSDEEEQQSTKNNINTQLLDDFLEYTKKGTKDHRELGEEVVAGIELLNILTKSGAPLGLYDSIYAWHVKYYGVSVMYKLGKLLPRLRKRYNMDNNRPKVVRNVSLPHSQCNVNLVVHTFKDQVVSLLSDPRIRDEDYLFLNDDPFHPPPTFSTTIGDVNTGIAYRETYKKIVKNPGKDVPLGIIFYMDGAITGQYDHLPIEAVKFTLCIFNRKTRDKAWAWRNLGYITSFLKQDTKAKEMLEEDSHIDTQHYVPLEDKEVINIDSEENVEDPADSDVDSEDEELNADKTLPQIQSCSGQDLHVMLDKILESYREIENGFTWNLRYKGRTLPVNFLPFVMFVKGDSKEHDKHCGHYSSKTAGVQQICRVCHCPTDMTDVPYKRYPKRDPRKIQSLIDDRNKEQLQRISQQYLENAWYRVRFACHNQLGIHDACPSEVLHWIQINKFKYVIAMFFAQTGMKSILTTNLEIVAKSMGYLFSRQSDRDKPRTEFSKGIRGGKLMAHEMSGVILVLLATIRCKKGQKLLLHGSRGKQKDHVGSDVQVQDWISLLELLLMWESWLALDEMDVEHVVRSEIKVRELMDIEMFVGKRDKGMKFKTNNFHACVHVADDILHFGVPSVTNTSSNESHHKPDKKAAKRTQRRAKVFDLQCGEQIHINHLAEMAMEEVVNGYRSWEYYHEDIEDTTEIPCNAKTEEEETIDVRNTGTSITLFLNEDGNLSYKVQSRMKDKERFIVDKQILSFIMSEINNIGGRFPIRMFTEHVRDGQMFRGSFYFQGKPWRDWVSIRWQGDVEYATFCQVWCFLDLTGIPESKNFDPGIYCVVENSEKADDEEDRDLSRLLKPYRKEVQSIDPETGEVTRKFYLAPVDSILSPITFIPDLGNDDPTAYLCLVQRVMRANLFKNWLEAKHEREFPGYQYAELETLDSDSEVESVVST